ncbi:MAG TPA: hypothetical protein VFY68_11785 [Nitrososphaeraceae archaeon]|jgi:hypothetical protein|nr:hypothetical protein [Nitrososphaeraceae archaeon]
MEKVFSTLRSFDEVSKNPKFCISCGGTATQEALFNVGGAMLIEKYCDICAKREAK